MHTLKRLILFLLVGAGAHSLHSNAAAQNAADQPPPAAPNQQADEKSNPGQSASQVSSGSINSGLDSEKERQARELLRSLMPAPERPRVGASPSRANHRRKQAVVESGGIADSQTNSV